MHSFSSFICVVALVGGFVHGRVLRAPMPVITPGPSVASSQIMKRDTLDAISLAEILLTAVPESLRQIAATNIPAVSSILWEEFLDDKRPEWFLDLPWEIQSYLIDRFGPATAVPTLTGPSYPSATDALSSLPWETNSGGLSAPTSIPFESSQVPPPSESASQVPSQSSPASSIPIDSSSLVPTLSTQSLSIPVTAPTASTPSASSTLSPTESTSTSTTTSDPSASHHSGLTRSQKLGIGIGVPLAFFAAAALALGCYLLLRRHQRKKVDGSIPPSSPGFIPRFAFQEKAVDDSEQRRPLNRGSDNSFADLHHMPWDDDVVDSSSSGETVPTLNNQQPIMAPALYHTHSSNRARGKRTSYSSLHSVAEVSEPDEAESPVLPRQSPPRVSPLRHSPVRHSPQRCLILPPVPVASVVKRKPVPSSPTHSSAATLASQSLLKQTMPECSSSPPLFGNHTSITSKTPPYVSPIEESSPTNPFRKYPTYEEDYGPEYNQSFIDVEDGLYGGHTSLSRYPEPRPSNAKTEWPLRNISGHRRNKSPLWDRVYDV